ncbi:MAG TPA: UDP-N-acetylglucosamine--N-acetylmuramyl-(pentapeptide) pyrophosphoryl-undecaprenol N-acetylglucosamine transferase [Candidatus Dormibacteraeota bacterium]
MPALAVAQACRAEHRDWPVLMVGRAGGPEERVVPAAGFALETVAIRGLDRDAVWKNLALPGLIPLAFRRGLEILERFKPDVVLGMGGYAMAPAVWAARRRGVPYVLHEKDVRPGLATRMFARQAAVVCTTLPGTEARLNGVRTVRTGVPLRSGFEQRKLAIPPRTLLVTGGSQGARRINQAVWGALDGLLERFQEVIHVAGRQGAAEVARIAKPGYRGFTFTDRMSELYGAADLLVARAGVSTIGEASAVGLPMLLVPGTFGGRHQELNARSVEAAGAGVTILDPELTPERLLSTLDELIARPERLRAMAQASRELGRPEAAQLVLRVVEEVAG